MVQTVPEPALGSLPPVTTHSHSQRRLTKCEHTRASFRLYLLPYVCLPRLGKDAFSTARYIDPRGVPFSKGTH